MTGLLGTIWHLKTGLFAIKGIVLIPLMLASCLYGVWSCNGVLSTYKMNGAIEIERQVLLQAQEAANKRLDQQKKVSLLHETSSKKHYEKVQTLEEAHRTAVASLHERILADESGKTCRECLVP